jgi:predicted Holliday junction resolvase-like endonuclease
MKFLFLILLFPIQAFPGQGLVVKKTSEAFLETGKGKKIKKNIENKAKDIFKNYINNRTAIIAGSLTEMIVSGKIDISKFNYKYKVLNNGYIIPHIAYDIYNNETTSFIILDIKY